MRARSASTHTALAPRLTKWRSSRPEPRQTLITSATTLARLKRSRSIAALPIATRLMSSRSPTSRAMCLVWRSITARALIAASLPGCASLTTCAAAVSAASGLRSSWLSMARNSSLARSLACSAAFSRSCSSLRSRTAAAAPRSASERRAISSMPLGFETRTSLPCAIASVASASAATGLPMRHAMYQPSSSAMASAAAMPPPMPISDRFAAASTVLAGIAMPSTQPLGSALT